MKLTPEEFVRTWQSAASILDVATISGTTPLSAVVRASRYRARGVKLKKFTRTISEIYKEEFVKAWQTSESLVDFAKKFKVSKRYASSRAAGLRSMGCKLKKFLKNDNFDVSILNSIVKTINVKENNVKENKSAHKTKNTKAIETESNT